MLDCVRTHERAFLPYREAFSLTARPHDRFPQASLWQRALALPAGLLLVLALWVPPGLVALALALGTMAVLVLKEDWRLALAPTVRDATIMIGAMALVLASAELHAGGMASGWALLSSFKALLLLLTVVTLLVSSLLALFTANPGAALAPLLVALALTITGALTAAWGLALTGVLVALVLVNLPRVTRDENGPRCVPGGAPGDTPPLLALFLLWAGLSLGGLATTLTHEFLVPSSQFGHVATALFRYTPLQCAPERMIAGTPEPLLSPEDGVSPALFTALSAAAERAELRGELVSLDHVVAVMADASRAPSQALHCETTRELLGGGRVERSFRWIFARTSEGELQAALQRDRVTR